MNMNINVKLLNDLAKLPTKAHSADAGYDLYAAIDKPIDIAPHSTVKISTGLAMEIPEGTFGGIFARSGIATKRGLRPANSIGVIDSVYRGEIIVALHNDSYEVQTVEPGERIAQLIVIPFVNFDFNIVDKLTDTDRSSSGFGSSGEK